MNSNIFINTGIDYAITMYLRSKDKPYSTLYNSFLVIVVRALIHIYGEDEIVDAYSKNDINTFKSMITKYGYEKFDDFKGYVQKFYDWAKIAKESTIKKNLEFTLIQQELIDMMSKKMDWAGSSDCALDFDKFLYTPNNPNPNMVIFNMQASLEPDSIEYYWVKALFKADNDIKLIRKKHNLLNPKFYRTINLTLEDVQKMSEEEVENKNNEIFKKFRVKKSDENFVEKLNKAVDNYLYPNIELTSGSGFADRMLLISIMVTLVCIAFIAGVMIFG